MRKPLYKISQEYMHAYNAMCGDEELSEEIIRDTLSVIEGEFNSKAINTAAIIKNIKDDSESLRNAELSIQLRRKRLDKRIEWLENNLLTNMMGTGIEKILSDEFDIKIRRNPAKVVVEDGAILSEEFLRRKEIVEPDKSKLKEALQKDVLIKGVRLVQENKLIIE